ncbi:tyrosine-type recombinase/integrase [Mesorhizobium sp. B1-1-5]|uniref:tyrosine-type recombinase/integrase n=1 Tax=Mesorhizobium sp. B1-1-5 TaxID=2589979 RepID=UPI001FEDD6E0|nr:tyrosine-type recombinase/integrase [Mesorhizobium sp. B1-1-5]
MTTKIKLTKRVVDAAMPRSGRFVLFDSEIKGFGLRVFPSGLKSWVFEYKADGGGRRATTKRVTIGKTDEFTPDEARKIADKLRSKAKIGQDPQAEKAEKREAATVSKVATEFLATHVNAKRKASTRANYEDILNRIVTPALGSKKARDVTRADIAKLHLGRSKTPFQANRILAVLSSMYAFAGKHGLVPEGYNPARGIEKFPETSRERWLSPDELGRLGASIRLAETEGIPWSIDPTKKSKHVPKTKRETAIGEHAAAALRLLIFTGARLREILHLKWSEVDLERGLLLLSDSKTGKKTIVLNAPSIEVLSKLQRVGLYVIAGESAGSDEEKPRSDLKRPWAVVTRHADLEDLRIHDLRHNFASFGAGGGLGLPIIGKLLGHAQASTTQRYAHLDADPLRRATNTIGNTIATAMGEGKTSSDANLLKLGKL